jgi:hypothetical protein
MADPEQKLAMPADTHHKVPESVVASDMSFNMEKDQVKSETGSEVFAEQAKLDDAQNSPEGLSLQETGASEYPTKFKLVTILVAVVLAVFLVALDMVSVMSFPSLFGLLTTS